MIVEVSSRLVCVQGLANMGAQFCQNHSEDAFHAKVPSTNLGQNFPEWASSQLNNAGLDPHQVASARKHLLDPQSPLWAWVLVSISKTPALFVHQESDQIDKTIARLSKDRRKVGAWAHVRECENLLGAHNHHKMPKGCHTHPHSFCTGCTRGGRCQSCAPAVCFLRPQDPQGCRRQPQEDFGWYHMARGPARCSCRPQVMHGRHVHHHEGHIQVLQQG